MYGGVRGRKKANRASHGGVWRWGRPILLSSRQKVTTTRSQTLAVCMPELVLVTRHPIIGNANRAYILHRVMTLYWYCDSRVSFMCKIKVSMLRRPCQYSLSSPVVSQSLIPLSTFQVRLFPFSGPDLLLSTVPTIRSRCNLLVALKVVKTPGVTHEIYERLFLPTTISTLCSLSGLFVALGSRNDHVLAAKLSCLGDGSSQRTQ